jgi:putative peptidoglycan lipid II flippase
MNSAPPQSVLKGTAILFAGRVTGRLLGLVREVVAASLFGAGRAMDCFNLSFTVLISMRQLFAEQFHTPLVPAYFQRKEESGEHAALESLRAISTRLSLTTLIVCIGVFAVARQIITLIAPGFDEDQLQLSTTLLRWFAVGGLGIILHRFFSGVHTCFFRYTVVAFAPLLLNVGAISAMAFYAVKYGIVSLASGMALGFLAILYTLLFFLPHRNGVLKPRWGRGDRGLSIYGAMLMPLFIAVSFEQVQLFVDRALASGLPEGTLSAQGYALRFVRMTSDLFLGTLGTVFFPIFSSLAARGEKSEFSKKFSLALQGSMLILIMAGALLIAFALPIVRVLFERGAFTREATTLTSSLIVYYAVAYLGRALLLIIMRGFNAHGNTRIPVITTVISVAVMIAFDFILIGPMGIHGLALATAIGYSVNVLLIYSIFTRHLTAGSTLANLKTIITALVLAGAISWFLLRVWNALEERQFITGVLSQSIALILVLTIAIAVYSGCLFFLRVPALQFILEKIKHSRNNDEPAQPDIL